jgi:large subunit ribosomal protein L15
MKLHEIKKAPGSTHSRKRVGRGHSSGHGKTAGKGHKGQKARSGGGVRPGFEGGQMPLYRRLPHRGFSTARFREEIAVVNLADLARIEGSEVTPEVLKAANLVRSNASKVKLLGNGEVTRALQVSAHAFSASAKEKIEQAGGSVTLL